MKVYILLDFVLNKSEAKRPKISAAVMPAADDEIPPVIEPISPSLFTASLTPRPIFAPKPIRGTDTPAPNKFCIGSYIPTAYKSTPTDTYSTRIFAGVSLVKSIKSWAITQTKPPDINAKRNCSVILIIYFLQSLI